MPENRSTDWKLGSGAPLKLPLPSSSTVIRGWPNAAVPARVEVRPITAMIWIRFFIVTPDYFGFLVDWFLNELCLIAFVLLTTSKYPQQSAAEAQEQTRSRFGNIAD